MTHAKLLAVLLCLGLAAAALATKPAAGPRKGLSGPELLTAILTNTDPFKAGAFLTLKPDEIKALAEAYITKLDTNLNLTAASVKNPSWAATVQPQVDNAVISNVVSGAITFPSSMSTDKATRDASLAAADRVSQWSVDANMRTDVYEALKAFNKTQEAKALKGEQARFFTFALRDARRSGLDLPKDKRDELSALLKKMAKIKLDFSACLDADTTHLSFLPSELNGTTKEFVAGLKRDPNNTNKARFTSPGLVIVTVKYPDYFPIIQECTVESTRKQMEFAYNNVCADTNTKRLDDLVALRAKVAAILGYANWAAYTQETLMAKNPERVMKFLTELRAKLVKLRDQQYDVLLQYKRQEKEAQGKKFDGVLNSWEGSFYAQQARRPYMRACLCAPPAFPAPSSLDMGTARIEKRDFSVDKQEVQQYFPIAYVVPKLLDVYQELLGLRFQLDSALSKAAWAPGIEAYKVFDAKSKELLGIFYLDLHPREGKFGHAAMFGLQPPSWIQVGGKTEKLIGVGSLMCNFPDDTPTQPGLLPHDDVTTLFHEMGHMFHQILGRTKIASFAGTSTDTDFVEAPSQMLENWTWEPEVLRRITKHHKTGKIMPEHLIAKLVKSRVANAGISNMKQLAYGLYDQKVHTSTNISTADTYIQVMRDVTRIPPQTGTHPAARFGHLIGYDAQYYSYLWSQVFSADMYATRFKKQGIFNPIPGRDYRKDILEPGGSMDPDVLLRRFLGRDPTQDAFLKSIGLNTTAITRR